MNTLFKPVVIIPHYNHSTTISNVVEQLATFDLAVLIIDDGSSPQHHSVLHILADKPKVSVHYRTQNGGKGAAVKTGLQLALELGFTHAIQVDADGQHHLPDVIKMLKLSEQQPKAIICGRPIYSKDAPKSRLYGRKITNFWIAINTLSTEISDGMCGFRLYPLTDTVALIQQEYIGDYMDFDTEILVKAHWWQIPILWVDTPVKYTLNGVSHFRGWQDNWLISKMHARLFFGMLWRIATGKKV
ncbi:glycosyltransferase family 2 protein [Ursidibacter sp. B-7004-1]